MDRALLYGDGFFTTIRVVDNKIHRWPLHLERLSFSAKRLKFYSLDANQIYQDLLSFIQQQPESDGVLRLTIGRGANGKGERGYSIPKNPEYQFYMNWSPLNNQSIKNLDKGVSLSLCQTPISQNKALAGVKHLNRLDQVLASDEIAENCFDGLMFNKQFIVSGTKTNVYFYRNNRWLTPKVNKAGVNGTVRRWLLETQEDFAESKFGLEILKSAQYCLVSNAIVGIIPVTQIQMADENKKFMPFPELNKLQAQYNEVSIRH
ncbi:aminodeoxychorismate lyase [Kangiella sp. TOML190]|uniref:aminodeoxychorismate lyase n=1 Tax=Kangiella sp. TOML190 TaxID=2931351 RepID=UPI00203DEAD9|nr:aminodeoxychorismate lyase [Kangiella sp. TOML190]